MGLNATLYTAGRSLELFSAGIQVAGQNVANANTPGYVREQLNITTAAPYQSNGLLFGTGAQAAGIRQQIDLHLESQVHLANADARASDFRVSGYSQLELIVGELGSNDLSSRLNQFLGSLNEVVGQPELLSNRQQVVNTGEQLASSINTMRDQLDRARESVSATVSGMVTEVNELIQQIAALNPQIVQMESAGLLKSDAGGLRSERLTALNRLSELVPIRVTNHDNGTVDVFSGNEFLVLNSTTNVLEVYREPDRGIGVDQVRFAKSKQDYAAATGELAGALETRDVVLGGFVDTLDQYTRGLIYEMNRLHSSGEGTVGYTNITSSYALDDATVSLDQAGLDFPVQHGSFEVKLYDSATGSIVATSINIDLDGLGGNDTSLNDLQAQLGGISHVQASVDTFGKLNITTDAGFEIRFGNDTSGVLAALGINTFFKGTDANSVAVNEALTGNPQLFAAGRGGGAGDNSNAILLARFSEQPSSLLGGLSLDDFYLQSISQVATGAAAETAVAEGYAAFQAALFGQRQQISGVSLDEEAIRILELQHGYTAAARIISAIEEMFNTLVNM